MVIVVALLCGWLTTGRGCIEWQVTSPLRKDSHRTLTNYRTEILFNSHDHSLDYGANFLQLQLSKFIISLFALVIARLH